VVFYTLDQAPTASPRLIRQNDACLTCHASSQNQGFPGHLLRSVYSDAEGFPILSAGSFHIDQSSPLKDRWGGWYVTGTTGKQSHMGNLVVQDPRQANQTRNPEGLNVTDLGDRFNKSAYLTGHSDIVALMVLEHQTEMQNLITRANFLTRMALFEEKEINRALGRPADYRSETTLIRIKGAAEPLLRYLLFSGEAAIAKRIRGTSRFRDEFVENGRRDQAGRSLRDLDLERRLFRYPCSYLIYSDAFDALPEIAKSYVFNRLRQVLTGKDQSETFAHLSRADRRAIFEIITATKSGLPADWR
jgi:hypothetical protein